MRCVDCVCATEPPCSSDNGAGDAGAAALACALEKNTTLHTLYLQGEFVVVCFVWGGVLIVDYGVWVVVCLWLGWRGVCVVLIVCAPLNRRVHQRTKWAQRELQRLLALWRRTRPCTRCTLAVSLLWCVLFGEGLIVDYGVWDVDCLWLGWRGVCVVLIVCAPLKRRVHQTTKWATRELQRWLALWRRTRPCTRWTFGVSLLWCVLFRDGVLIVVYGVWDVVCLWLGWRGVCVVLIVCAPLNRRVHQTTTYLPPFRLPWVISPSAIGFVISRALPPPYCLSASFFLPTV